ncbi:MAG: DUF2190 domain-containing protein [Rhodospirillaceae bacterium]|nr:MAG: DUF2190 domain-containing protein [Rhodospirillaceae bacterium]
MGTPTLTKNFIAEAAITKRRIVKFGTADGQVVQGAAVTDALFGVSADLDAAINERIDVHVAGIVEVEIGAAVTRGDLLTADANGKAVAAAPAAGVNNNIIGHAMVSAVDGDIADVLLAPGSTQG